MVGPPAPATGDAPGAALLVGGLMLVIGAIVGGGPAGPWLGVAGMLSLAAFARRQRTAANPLVPLGVLRSRTLVAANLAQALLVGAMFGFQFLVALYFQRVLGYRPAQAGLAVLPVALGIGATSLGLFPRLVARAGARAVLVPALAAIAAGLALLARAPVDGRYLADVAPSVALFALGGGLALPALMTLAMAAASERDAGLASGLLTMSQQVGGALGLAVLAALAAARTHDLAAAGAGHAAALVGGFHVAWAAGAGLLAVALAVVVGLRAPSPTPGPRRAPPPGGRRRAPEGCRAG